MISMVPMEMELSRGQKALDLLEDPSFRDQWDALHVACPWATALQTRAFADIWYAVYGAVWEPLLVLARDDSGKLSGLLALARHRSHGILSHAGAHQAEYQVWLSNPGDGDAFIEAALEHLAARFPGGQLTLTWLPPGAPVGWLEPARPWASRSRSQSFPRPLMTVGPGSTVEATLRKKSNRHRLNRLGDLGPVRLEVLRSRRDLEPHFDQIVDFCNFRNAARYGCLPFQDDPLKKAFYLRLADCPEILHASVLMAGDTLVAANIGERDATSVQVGLITQSPFASSHSPGKFLLLLLGRQLAAEGLQDLDLTPSVNLGYKDRFADHFDTVHTCTVYFREQDAVRFDRKHRLISLLKAGLGRIGLTPSTIRTGLGRISRQIRGKLPTTLFFQALRWGGRKVWSTSRLNIYRMDPKDARVHMGSDRFSRDSLSDLLAYQPTTPADRTKFEFLREAFHRLEEGGRVFTLLHGGRLIHCAWVIPVTGPVVTGLGSHLEVPPGSVLLRDDHSHPSIANDEWFRNSVRTRLQEAASLASKDGSIFIQLPARDQAACQAMDHLGFQPHAVLTRSIRFGITRWIWRFE